MSVIKITKITIMIMIMLIIIIISSQVYELALAVQWFVLDDPIVSIVCFVPVFGVFFMVAKIY